MAARSENDFSCSVQGSDYVFEFTCDPCSNDGQTVEAINYCVECSEHFCSGCTKHHNRFGGTADHNVVNSALAKTASGLSKASTTAPIKETCREHHGERLTTFCADHDVVICNTCVSVEHRLCDGISYIPKVAGSSDQMQDNAKVQKQITESLKGIDETKQSLQAILASADGEEEEQIGRINDYTERLIKHARDLEEAAVTEVKHQYELATDKLQSGIKSLDDASSTLETRLKSTNNTLANNDSQIFVDIKRGKQEVAHVRNLQQDLEPLASGNALPEYVIGEDVDTFLNEVCTLGLFVEKKTYKAVLVGEYDVRMSDEEYVCRVADSCELADGSVLIVDYSNKSLKKLDTSYRVTECLKLPSFPYGICKTSDDEIAVTLGRKVQFVSVRGQLKSTRSFSVGDVCRGINFIQNELYLACGKDGGDNGFVGVYDTSGLHLRNLKVDQEMQQIVCSPHHIAATDSGDKVYVTDFDGGVITLDPQGKVLSRFSHGALQGADGVCALADGSVLVCGSSSDNVLQIDPTGRLLGKLLDEEDGLEYPASVHLLRDRSTLVLTEDKSDTIKVYNFE